MEAFKCLKTWFVSDLHINSQPVCTALSRVPSFTALDVLTIVTATHAVLIPRQPPDGSNSSVVSDRSCQSQLRYVLDVTYHYNSLSNVTPRILGIVLISTNYLLVSCP